MIHNPAVLSSEARIQADAFQYIWGTYPETRGCIWHVPNGGLRDKISANILKAQGLVAGIQDLQMIWNGQPYFIELKDNTGKVDVAQKWIHAKHMLHGVPTYIFRTKEEVIRFVEAIIHNLGLDQFTGFISPYSDANKVELYAAEYKDYKLKQAARYKKAA